MSLSENKKRIKQMLRKPPSSWKRMFLSKGLGDEPQDIDKIIETLLSLTPTERSSGPAGQKSHIPPAKTRKEAMKGIELSYRENYTSASGIGLARAMQLATWPKIWDRSVRRMDAYFDRHDKDQNARNFGNDEDPSRGYMAWLNWGGDSGEEWAEEKKSQMAANPRYRRNFFGLFSSAPTYYVVESSSLVNPLRYYDAEDYLRNTNQYKRSSLSDALDAAKRLSNEFILDRRGGDVIFVIQKEGSNISFIDNETAEPKSFEDFKLEFRA